VLEQQLAQHERQSLKARQLAMAHGLPTDDRDGTAADVAGTMSYIKSVCDLPAFSLRRTRVAANKRSPLQCSCCIGARKGPHAASARRLDKVMTLCIESMHLALPGLVRHSASPSPWHKPLVMLPNSHFRAPRWTFPSSRNQQ
jgi:hypothetical protein